MSDPKAQQEPTMEEILSSIRRIISEDQESEGEEGAGEEPVAVAEAEPDEAVEAEPAQAVEPEAADLAADLDVPEALPEAIDDSAEDEIEEVVVQELQTTEPQEADTGDMEAREEVVAEIDAVASADDEFDESVLDLTEVIDAGEETEVEVPQPVIPEPELVPEPELAPEPVPEPPPPPPPPAPASLESAQASHDTGAALNLEAELMSDTTASAAASAFTDLARGVSDVKGVPLGGGNRTIEELVKELIRPMLKEWFDHNLPPLVERLVEREISKLAGRADDRSY